jgi:HEAT repeat protein
MLEDPDKRVRHETVMSLGSIADEEATRLLLKALEAEDKEIRWRAAMHLGKIGGADVRKVLEERLEVETDEDVRKYLLKALS